MNPLAKIIDRAESSTPLSSHMSSLRHQLSRAIGRASGDNPSWWALNEVQQALLDAQKIAQDAMDERSRLDGDV